MGILSSIGKMFGGAPQERRAKNLTTNGRVPSLASPSVGVMDQATALREHLRAHDDAADRPSETNQTIVLEPDTSVEEDRDVAEAPISVPRNKQELFEELQKNYRDVVDLVRKVDAHLDRNERRADEMLTIARRIDSTLPSLERFPEQVKEQLDHLNEEVVGAIRESSAKGEVRASAVQRSLETIGARIESTSEHHAQLVSTMAGFRETLGDLAESSTRTGDVLERIDSRRQQREDELTKMLVASRRWSVTAIAVALVGVSAAVAVAVVALVVNAG